MTSSKGGGCNSFLSSYLLYIMGMEYYSLLEGVF